MKNDANNVLVDQDGLYGDGPGAAVVTIEVDGRKLQLPRSTLINILNSAGNRVGEKLATPEVEHGRTMTLLKAQGHELRDAVNENSAINYRYWKDLETFCQQLHDFARSSR